MDHSNSQFIITSDRYITHLEYRPETPNIVASMITLCAKGDSDLMLSTENS